MKKYLFCILLCLSTGHILKAQVKVGDNPQNIDASSLLELESNNRVFVISRVNDAQMQNITPLNGAIVYNTDEQCVFYYDGVQWVNLCSEANTTNVSLELIDEALVLTDSDGNSVSVPLEGIGEQTFTTDPMINFNETITITQTGNNFNFEVSQITGENIADSTIQGVDFAPNSITEDKLAPLSVSQGKLQENAVADFQLDYSQVTLNDFTNDAGFITSVELISPNPNNAITDVDGAFYDDSQLVTNIANNDQRITDHLALDNDLSDQNERLTNAEVQGDELVLTESGVETRVDLAPFNNTGTDEQNLSLNGNRIEIDNGNGVDLEPLLVANNVGVIPTGNISSDNVQLALEELQGDIDNINAGGANTDEQDLGIGTGGTPGESVEVTITNGNNAIVNIQDGDFDDENEIQDAVEVDINPITGITGDNVQLALEELQTDIAALNAGGGNTDEQDLGIGTGGTPGESVEVTITNGNNTLVNIQDGDFDDENEIQDAIEVDINPITGITGDNVQLALEELQNDIDVINTATDENTTNATLATTDTDADGTDDTLTLTDSEGGTVTVALADINTGADQDTTNATLATTDTDADGTDDTLTLTDSDGGTVTVALADINTGADQDTTNATLATTDTDADGTDDTLTLTDSEGGTVTVALTDINTGVDENTTNATLATTDTDADGTDDTLTLTDSDGGTVTVALADINTGADQDTTNATLATTDTDADGTDDTLTLTDSEGGTVTVALTDINTGVDENTTNATLATTDTDADGTDDTLTLTDSEGGTVTVALADINTGVDENTTNATLATTDTDADGTDDTLTLTDSEGGTVTVALADINTGVDENTTNATLATTDTDADGTDDTLTLTDSEGGTVTVALADINTGVDENTTNATLATTDTDADGTDDTLTLTDSEGGTVTVPLADINTETFVGSSAGEVFFANDTDFAPTGVGNEFYWDPNGRLGAFGALYIGVDGNTQTSQAKVQIADNFPGLGYALQLSNYSADDGNEHSTGILFSTEIKNDGFGKGALVYQRNNTAAQNFARGDFHFLQNTSPNFDNPEISDAVMTIKNNGDVGIGITEPTQQLHVTNNIRVEGQFYDSNNESGTSGQILSSTGTGTDWIDPTGGGTIVSTDTDQIISVGGDGGAFLDNASIDVTFATDLEVTTAFNAFTVSGGPTGIINPNSITQGDIGLNAIGAGEIQSDAVSSDEIEDASILNEDIAATAAIDGFKIIPDFTQGITTTGGLSVQADIILNGNMVVPDYVFQNYFDGFSNLNEDYKFKSLSEIEHFLQKNKHLPGVTSAAKAKKEGHWNLSKSNLQNLEKIEELFLHTIEQEKKIKALQSKNTALNSELEALKKDMALIKAMLLKNEQSN
ncbi:hypothetical protein MTsPCn5_11380 [Croceitalea sp. MTPC5]|uniref:beta strand repeat-containing protein n=1 Tax=Croceitalea sp. MTPC5 TaxID=3056565 RepID=UPI002B38AD85|nr:hypothetical protein MTsPCn5_11380 [Croceitalea sp. MTPC5]